MPSEVRTIAPDSYPISDRRNRPSPEKIREAHQVAVTILNCSDDLGYFNANPKLVESTAFPYREPQSLTSFLILELERIGYIETTFTPDGQWYGRVVHKGQNTDRARGSKETSISLAELESLFLLHSEPSTQLPM